MSPQVVRTFDERGMHCFAYRLSRPLKTKLIVTQGNNAVNHAHVVFHVNANLRHSAMLHAALLCMRKESVTKQETCSQVHIRQHVA